MQSANVIAYARTRARANANTNANWCLSPLGGMHLSWASPNQRNGEKRKRKKRRRVKGAHEQ